MPHVAVINGSLRQASINGRLARALIKLSEPRLTLKLLRIDDLPLFNQDMESKLPAPVSRMKQEVAAADAVLFITPEHNRSMSAAMKNVIDWGTRPYGTSVWLDKPGATIGTSQGTVGTAAETDSVTDEALHKVLTAYVDALVKWLARLDVVQK